MLTLIGVPTKSELATVLNHFVSRFAMECFIQPFLFFGIRHFDFYEFINDSECGIAKAKGVNSGDDHAECFDKKKVTTTIK